MPAEYTKSPTIPYPGAKGRLAKTLVSFMPTKGRTYVEPFAGRGNVFFAAALNCIFNRWVINDIATAPFFKALASFGDRVVVPNRSRSEFGRMKQQYERGDPVAVLLEPYLTFSGGGYTKGGFGGMRSAGREGYTRTLRTCSSIMRQTAATVSDLNWTALKLNVLGADDFVFLDPPYYGADVRAYSSRHFDYDGLVSTLAGMKSKWLLTEYKQPFYLKALGKPFFEREVQLACDRLGTRSRIECCWKNY
jgi:site-specific DNA-adenine methylase